MSIKKFLAGVFIALGLTAGAYATDYGSLYLNTLFAFTVPQDSGSFNDTAEFTVNGNGPVNIIVQGSLHISSGSGRSGGYHSEYDLVDIDSLNVTDVNGNSVCQPTQSYISTGRAQVGYTYFTTWSCSIADLPPGKYTLNYTGHITDFGNIKDTVGYGYIRVTAPLL